MTKTTTLRPSGSHFNDSKARPKQNRTALQNGRRRRRSLKLGCFRHHPRSPFWAFKGNRMAQATGCVSCHFEFDTPKNARFSLLAGPLQHRRHRLASLPKRSKTLISNSKRQTRPTSPNQSIAHPPTISSWHSLQLFAVAGCPERAPPLRRPRTRRSFGWSSHGRPRLRTKIRKKLYRHRPQIAFPKKRNTPWKFWEPSWPVGDPVGNPVGNPVENPVGDLVGNPIGNPVGNPVIKNPVVGNLVKNPVKNPVKNRVGNPVGNPLGNPVRNLVGNPVKNPIGNPLGNHFGNAAGNVVGNPVKKPVGNPVRNPVKEPYWKPCWEPCCWEPCYWERCCWEPSWEPCSKPCWEPCLETCWKPC